MDSEETLKYLQQKYPEDLNENYRCYWWCTSNIDGSALTYYLVLHDKFCETDKEPMICLRAHSSDNMTPIGDAISARDTYNAVKNRDWLSAGLAALTVLPFVPSGLRNVKAAARYIPTVNRTEQSLINQALGNISKKRDYLSDIANSRNRVLEDINTIPYRNRAEQADKIFGTNLC